MEEEIIQSQSSIDYDQNDLYHQTNDELHEQYQNNQMYPAETSYEIQHQDEEEEIKPIILFDYRPGDQVLIKSEDFLYKNLPQFSPNFDCINPLIIPDISDQYGVVLEVYIPQEMNNDSTEIDIPYAMLYLSLYNEEFRIYLPYTCFDFIQYKISEKEEELTYKKEVEGIFYDPFFKKSSSSYISKSNKKSNLDFKWINSQYNLFSLGKYTNEKSMNQNDNYSRNSLLSSSSSYNFIHDMAAETIQKFYKGVQLKSKSKSLLSTNSLVKNLASETITKSFRR